MRSASGSAAMPWSIGAARQHEAVPDEGDGCQPDGVDDPPRHRCAKMRLSRSAAREPPAMSITMIGIDTAKSIFHLHGVDAQGKVLLKRKLGRDQLIGFFE